MKTKNGYKGWIYRHWIVNDDGVVKSYIGRCVNTPLSRWKTGYAHCTVIQRAFDKYGYDNFHHDIIGVVEASTKEELNFALNEWEKYYIEKYDSYYNGYNCTLGGDGTVGYKLSDDAKKKIGDKHRGKKVSNETKKKRIETRQKTGYTHSEQTRKKMSESSKGKPKDKAAVEKMKQTKKKNGISKKQRQHYKNSIGKPNSRSKQIINLETGFLFATSTQAATWCNGQAENIRACCKHKISCHKGLHFMYYDEYKKGVGFIELC